MVLLATVIFLSLKSEAIRTAPILRSTTGLNVRSLSVTILMGQLLSGESDDNCFRAKRSA